MLERTLTFPGPASPAHTLAPHRRGPGDPCLQIDPDGTIWRTSLQRSGPVTARITRTGPDTVVCEAWGAGAAEFIENLPALLGADDDASGFHPTHPTVVRAQSRVPHLRIGRTGRVLEALIPAILEQRVQGVDPLHRAPQRDVAGEVGERRGVIRGTHGGGVMSAALRLELVSILGTAESYLRATSDLEAKVARSLLALKVAQALVRTSGGNQADAVALAFDALRAEGQTSDETVRHLKLVGVEDPEDALEEVEERESAAADETERDNLVPWGGDL